MEYGPFYGSSSGSRVLPRKKNLYKTLPLSLVPSVISFHRCSSSILFSLWRRSFPQSPQTLFFFLILLFLCPTFLHQAHLLPKTAGRFLPLAKPITSSTKAQYHPPHAHRSQKHGDLQGHVHHLPQREARRIRETTRPKACRS